MTATVRPVGRPRSTAADCAILEAALEVFAELGFDGLTVEEVAARAGVGKCTIYRRYACKVDLVIAATRRICGAQSPESDTGTISGDLRSLGRGLVRALTRTPAGPAINQLIAEVPRNAELAAAHRAFIDARRAMTVAAIRRGIERGELRPDADPGLVADALAGPIFYRYLVSHARLDAGYVDRVVDELMRAFGT